MNDKLVEILFQKFSIDSLLINKKPKKLIGFFIWIARKLQKKFKRNRKIIFDFSNPEKITWKRWVEYTVCCLVQCAISYECAPLTVCLFFREFIQLQYFCYAFRLVVCVDVVLVCVGALCVCLFHSVWRMYVGPYLGMCVSMYLFPLLFELHFQKLVCHTEYAVNDFRP